MVDISDKLNEAFNANEREIKAYISIDLDKPEFTSEGSVVCTSPDDEIIKMPNIYSIDPTMATDITINDHQKNILLKEKDMAIEENRVKLNGSYTLVDKLSHWTTSNKFLTTSGIISKSIASTYNDFTIILTASGFIKGSSSLTIYFEENIPTDITLTETNNKFSPKSITGNNEQVLNINLGAEVDDLDGNDVEIEIVMQGFTIPEQRIRIKRIEFGYSTTFENDEIIDMQITEQVKKFCEETPENECVIKLQNVDDKFNVLNQEGITNILNEGGVIRPFIGAKTEDNDEEYVGMGVYYIEKFENNYDNTATIYAKNLIKKIKDLKLNKKIGTDGPFEFTQTVIIDGNTYIDYETGISEYLKNVYDIDNNIENNIVQDVGYNDYIKMITFINFSDVNLIDYLQTISISFKDIMYVDRNNKLIMKRLRYPDYNVYRDISIDDNSYIEEPKINKINPINIVKLIYPDAYKNIAEDEEVMEIKHKLTSNEEILKVVSDFNKENTYIQDIIGGTVQIVESNNRTTFYKLNGNIGDTVSFKQKYLKRTDGRKLEFDYNYNNEEIEDKEKEVLEINAENYMLYVMSDGAISPNVEYRFITHYLYTRNKYEVEFEFIGNPAIEAGDFINLQTKYGDMYIFIESIEYEFDGGLRSKIKGIDMDNIS